MKMKNQDEAKPKENEVFVLSGPAHLTLVDWRIAEHRRSVAASLVQGVYILQKDVKKNRKGDKAEAPKWWEFFNFKLCKPLKDDDNSTTYGAIFEYQSKDMERAPSYVVAFRGTATKRDLYIDVMLALNSLSSIGRYKAALQAVQGLVSSVGPASVWLAGHSLGAAIALQAGKEMAKMGCRIDTYLFNPPHVSFPYDAIKGKYLRNRLRIAGSLTTAGLYLLGKALEKNRNKSDSFSVLCEWIPNLYVNPEDKVSREYIGCFEFRKTLNELGMIRTERILAEHNKMSLIRDMLGGDGEASQQIPSAFLTKNMIGIQQTLKVAHGIQQWWKPHPHLHSQLYQMSC